MKRLMLAIAIGTVALGITGCGQNEAQNHEKAATKREKSLAEAEKLAIYGRNLFVAITAAYAWVRPFFASRLAGLSTSLWLKRVLCPLALLAAATLGVGFVCRVIMPEGLVRLFVTTCSCEVVLLPLAWAILFDTEDRAVILRKVFGERVLRA